MKIESRVDFFATSRKGEKVKEALKHNERKLINLS